MWIWLTKLDPNVIVPIVVGLVTWGYSKVRGKQKTDERSIIDSVIETFASELLDLYTNQDVTTYLKTMREYVNERVWKVLSKRGVPQNSLTRRIVNEAIERWSAWLGGQLLMRRSGPLSTVLK